MNKADFKKYFGDGLLIVFSVLFALFINKTYEDFKVNKIKDNATKQIKAELLNNQKILNEWIEDHDTILKNLNKLIESKDDSIEKLVKSKGYFPAPLIFNNKSLMGKALSNSAWNSAQSIGIISQFDFVILQKISETYELQQLIMESSIEKIAERYFLLSSNIDNTKALLIELRLRFQNMRGQEYLLANLYKETIKNLE